MHNIKRQFKVLSLRFKKWMYISLNSEVDKDYINIQKKAEQIILKGILNESSTIYIYNDTFYIKYKNFIIKFDDKNSLISNNKFTYYITLSENVTKKLKNQYRQKILKNVLEIDKTCSNTMIENLSKMIKDI